MFRRISLFTTLAAIISAACFLWSSHAPAQPSPNATASAVAGKETILLESSAKIEVKTPPVKGSASVAVSLAEPKTYRLLYTPSNTVGPAADELTYQKADDAFARTIKIEIVPMAPGLSDRAYQESFKAVFLLFILAVMLESALAVLFNWRPFVETFNARAIRPLVSFMVALVFVHLFELDIVTSLVNSSTTMQYPVNVPGKILTAFTIAGGSSGINTMLVALGYRQVKTPETVAPKPPPQKGWISVRAVRAKAIGTIEVFIGTPVPRQVGSAQTTEPPVVGTIIGTSGTNMLRYFLRDLGRFPGYGGFEVAAGQECAVKVKGTDANGGPVELSWGPHSVAGGAIIDLEFRV